MLTMSILSNINKQIKAFHVDCLTKEKVKQLNDAYQLSFNNPYNDDAATPFVKIYNEISAAIEEHHCKAQLGELLKSANKDMEASALTKNAINTMKKNLKQQIAEYWETIKNVKTGVYKEYFDSLKYTKCIRTLLWKYKRTLDDTFQRTTNSNNKNDRILFVKAYDSAYNIIQRHVCREIIESMSHTKNSAAETLRDYDKFEKDVIEGRFKERYDAIQSSNTPVNTMSRTKNTASQSSNTHDEFGNGGLEGRNTPKSNGGKVFATVNGVRRLVRIDSKGRSYVRYQGKDVMLMDNRKKNTVLSKESKKSNLKG